MVNVHLLSMIRKLPKIFGDLRVSLLAWRDMSYGLPTLKHLPEDQIAHLCQHWFMDVLTRMADQLQRDIALPSWSAESPGEVLNGPELIDLMTVVRHWLGDDDGLAAIHYALIGLVHIEEPGDLTVDQVLMTF